jgi:Na+/H+-dicarboxylate symporter
LKASNRFIRWIAASIVLGIAAGYICHQIASGADDASRIAGYFSIVTATFLRLIKMIIAPLVFATLVSGIASMDDSRTIGRTSLKTLCWFVAASLSSLVIGLLFVNVMPPGAGMNLRLSDVGATPDINVHKFNLQEFVTQFVPDSVLSAMASNQIMQILVFSLFFGVALAKVKGDSGRSLRQAIDGLQSVMLYVTTAVMLFAPIGIFAALAAVITAQGLGVLASYGKFIGSFYVALACLWAFLIFAGYLVLKGRMLGLLRQVRAPILLAFSTASSEAAYPLLITSLESFGVQKRLVGFVLPLGYSFNLDGSMIYQAFAAVFIAQAFNVHMSLGTQTTMLLALMISSKGMAAVPRGSLVVVAAILPMFGLPEAGIALILGIDQFLDMGRTATNVLGNSIATAVVAKWEGELGVENMRLD